MIKNLLKNLPTKTKAELFDALFYMNMKELKTFCNKHKIATAGKKGAIIARIKHYLSTGEILPPKTIPDISKAKAGKTYSLTPDSPILYGAYKNDLKTRLFLKSLVGQHFHFTAFGQDWIQNRWQQGKPPTYREFAKAWQTEYKQRKKSKAQPKQEWAYLNFMQRYPQKNKTATKFEIANAWKKLRAEKAKQAMKILTNIKPT